MAARRLTRSAFTAVKARPSWMTGVLLGLAGLHLLLTACYFPPGEMLRNPPIANTDYNTHFYHAAVVAHILATDGHSWGYDPYLLAGYPAGTVLDIDNKGFALGVWLLGKLGLPPGPAFNLLVIALVLLVPVAGWAAARLLGASPGATLAAVAFFLLLWYLDPAFHWAWGGGTFAFAIAALWAPAGLAALQRVWLAPNRTTWAVLALLAVALPLVHGMAFLLLGLPAFVAYASTWLKPGAGFRRLTWRQHVGLIAVVLLALAANAYWLIPLGHFISIKTTFDRFLQTSPELLWQDLIGLGKTEVGLPRLYPVRWAAVGLLALGWSDPARRRGLLPWTVGGVAWLGLAYFGSLAQVGRDLQPYRFVMPAAALAVPPAAVTLTSGTWRNWLGCPWRLRYILAGGIILGLTVQFGLVVGDLLPWQAWLTGRPMPADARLHGPPLAYQELAAWLRAHTTSGGGRILVNDWRLGAFLAADLALTPEHSDGESNGRQIIGGPHLWVGLQHGYANAGIWDLFGRDLQDYTPDELGQALQTYNVQWALTNADWPGAFYTLDSALAAAPGLMQPVTTLAGFHIYRATWPANDFLVGRGQVQVDYNRLVVHGASPGGVVLKMHWLPTWRSDPPLPLRPYPVLEDPVGFIHVDNGSVTDFTLYNGYVWEGGDGRR